MPIESDGARFRVVADHKAQRELAEFARRWNVSTIAVLWQRHWERVILFFEFAAEIRNVIYTTNVESLNMALRKSLKTRGAVVTTIAGDRRGRY